MSIHVNLQKLTHCRKCGGKLKVTHNLHVVIVKKCEKCNNIIVIPQITVV